MLCCEHTGGKRERKVYDARRVSREALDRPMASKGRAVEGTFKERVGQRPQSDVV